jgi:hypothetical protein
MGRARRGQSKKCNEALAGGGAVSYEAAFPWPVAAWPPGRLLVVGGVCDGHTHPAGDGSLGN